MVQFSSQSYVVNENASVLVCVELEDAISLDRPITLQYAIANGPSQVFSAGMPLVIKIGQTF